MRVLKENAARTPGRWRCRPMQAGRGIGCLGYIIEAELPCISGRSAWFMVASIYEREDEVRSITGGVIADAKTDAEAICRLVNSHKPRLSACGKTAAPLSPDHKTGERHDD